MVWEKNALPELGDAEYGNPLWDDLRVSVTEFFVIGLGSDPGKLTYKGTRIYEFAAGEELGFAVQLPHRYKEGTNLKPHIH